MTFVAFRYTGESCSESVPKRAVSDDKLNRKLQGRTSCKVHREFDLFVLLEK